MRRIATTILVFLAVAAAPDPVYPQSVPFRSPTPTPISPTQTPTAPPQQVSFKATVDKKVVSRFVDRLTYTLTVVGAPEAKVELPPFEGFEVLLVTENTTVKVINEQATSSQKLDCILMPTMEEEKDVVIPPARLRWGGKTYVSNSVPIKVVEGRTPSPSAVAPPTPPAAAPPAVEPPASPVPAPSPLPLFIENGVDPKEVFQGEQVTLAFRIFSQFNLAQFQPPPPPTVGFLEGGRSEWRKYKRVLDGVPYVVMEHKTANFPLRAGELAIGAAEIKGDILVQKQEGSMIEDFFAADFFTPIGYEWRTFSFRFSPIMVHVKPLPAAGRPADFRDAVGRFTMAVEVNLRRVKAGEPITLKVTVSGEGNIESVLPPVFRPGEGFKTYAPEVETQKRAEGDRLGGEKIFRQVVIPLKEGEQVIPAVEFSYFDPSSAAYRTEKSDPIAITVDPASAEGPAVLVEAAGAGKAKTSVALLQKDILYIKDNPGDLALSRRPFYRSGWYWAAHLVPVIIVLLVGRVQSQRDRLRSDRVYARKVRASRAARTRFKEAGRRLKAGKTAEFYASAHRAFVCYLGDKLGLPSGAVDYESVAGKLSVAGLPPEVLAAVKNAFDVCDRARYAPGASDPREGKHFLEAMEGIVDRLEKVKIR